MSQQLGEAQDTIEHLKLNLKELREDSENMSEEMDIILSMLKAAERKANSES